MRTLIITTITTIWTTVALIVFSACASPAQTTPTAAPAAPASAAPASVATAAAAAPTPAAPAPVATAPAAPTPVTAPAKTPMQDGVLTYTNLKINPSTVKVGDAVKVTIDVNNSGVMANFAVVLKVNGKVVDEQNLTCKLDIDCDETKQASFLLKMAAPGTYIVTVGDSSGTLVVQ